MTTQTSIFTSKDYPSQWQKKYQQSMQTFANNYEVLKTVKSPLPGLELEIRRFFWDKPTPRQKVCMEVCYLSLAITPRPATMEVDYLGNSQASYTSYGNCCFIPANQYTYGQGAVGEYEELCCLFDPAYLEAYQDWQWQPLELAACFNIKNMNIQNLLLRLASEISQPGYQSSALIEASFQTLIIELCRHFKSIRQSQENPSGTLSPHQLQKITDTIKASLKQDLSVDRLAELCGISNRHLSRMFKKTTGYTLGKYIGNERINQAQHLLAKPDLQIKEIAYLCGFKSQSSFAKTFHDAMGKTPSEYRRQLFAPPVQTN